MVQPPPWFYAWLFAMYVAQYFVIIFFNTALVGAAMARLDGRDPTVRSALKVAASRIGPIFGYAVISATVGVLLRAFAERLGFIGRLVVAGVGVAWTVATFLVVPILAAEGIGPLAAIAKSGALLRKSWGENLIGNTGIALTMGLTGGVIGIFGIGSRREALRWRLHRGRHPDHRGVDRVGSDGDGGRRRAVRRLSGGGL